MRVATPLSGRRVAWFLDSATTLLVVDLESRGRSEYFQTPVRCRSRLERAEEFVSMGVDTVVCDRVSRTLESMILARGIALVTGVTGDVDELLEDLDRRRPDDFRGGPRELAVGAEAV